MEELISIDQIPSHAGAAFLLIADCIEEGVTAMMDYQFTGLCYTSGIGGYYSKKQIFEFWKNNPINKKVMIMILEVKQPKRRVKASKV